MLSRGSLCSQQKAFLGKKSRKGKANGTLGKRALGLRSFLDQIVA
jgi:hypothetical protein